MERKKRGSRSTANRKRKNNRNREISSSDSDSNSKSSKNNDTNSSDDKGDRIINDATVHNSDDSKDSVVMNDDHNSNQLPSSKLDEIVPLITEDNETEFKSANDKQPTIKLVPMDRLLRKPSVAKENVIHNLDSTDSSDDEPLSKCKKPQIDNSNSSQQPIAKIIENNKKNIIYSSSDDKRVRSLRKKINVKDKQIKSKYVEISSEESNESNEDQSTDEEISIKNAIQSDNNKSDDVTINDLTNSQNHKKVNNFCVRLTKLPMDLKPLLQKYNLSEICDSQRNVRVSRENGHCVEVYIT